jgi:hypothetical protein
MSSAFDSGGYFGYESEYPYIPIVQNGLVLNLDISDTSSYPGSGDTIFDLSGSGFSSTRVGSISYQSVPPRSFFFPGVDNDRITIGSGFNSLYNLSCEAGQTFSVSVWYKWVSNPSVWGPDNHSHPIFGKSGGIASGATFVIFGSINSGYNNAGAGSEVTQFGVPAVVLGGTLTNVTTSRIDNNTWNNTTVTWDGSTARLYHNGAFTKNAIVGAAVNQLLPATLGAINDSPSALHKFQGNISSTLVYNRALSADEVQQNFNSSRERFKV